MQGNTLENESAISKLSKLFTIDNETGLHHPKMLLVDRSILAGCLAGFFIGGRIGARVGAVEHIENTKLEVYKSVTHAHRQYHGRVFLGFVKNGCRFGWRAGLFSGFYSLAMVVLSETTNNNDSLNLLGAGALTGVLYNCFSGWRKMVVGAIIGTGMSFPFAAFIGVVRFIVPKEKKEDINIFKLLSYYPVTEIDPSSNSNSSLDVNSNLEVTDVIDNLQVALEQYDEITTFQEADASQAKQE